MHRSHGRRVASANNTWGVMSGIPRAREDSRGRRTFSAMNAESSSRQCAKASSGNSGTAYLARAGVASLHSLKGNSELRKGASFPIQGGKDEMSCQIAVGFGALIVGLAFQESLGSLLGEAREQGFPPCR